jgi:hypothetical protein
MWTRDALQSPTAMPLAPTGGVAAPAHATAPAHTSAPATGSAGSKAFSSVLQQAKVGAQAPLNADAASAGPVTGSPARHTISQGETLIGVVRQQAQAQGVPLSTTEEHRLAKELASANRVSNANLIYPGQSLALTGLQTQLQAMQGANARPASTVTQTGPERLGRPVVAAAPSGTPLAYEVRSRKFTSAASMVAQTPRPKPAHSGAHPVLQKTLDRAVAKGFIPVAEKTAVYDKIVQMAGNHRFSPDDFARMTLMESDGMNPRASNQRCHGIIQFCDGPARGAASAGYGANPKAILDLSVHQQLSLVDKYFNDVGLKTQGPAGLEDLYLSVLNPASRAQGQANAPLNIPGQQARALHVGSDSAAPITRQSIRQGLLENASARLGPLLPSGLRVQAQRAQQYVQKTVP